MQQNSPMGGLRLDAPQPALHNTDLWATYLRGQVRTLLDPFGLAQPETVDVVARPLADMAAAAMSGWLSLFAAPIVRLAYDANKPQVNVFIAERGIDPDSIEIPREFAAQRGAPIPVTQLEEWAITSIYAEREPVLV